jgi:membrane protein
MATRNTNQGANTNAVSKDVQRVEKDIKPVQKKVKPLINFYTKFNNDWSFNFAGALAYSLLLSIFPIALAILAILGLIVGSLSPQAYAHLVSSITHGLPSYISGTIGSTLTKQQSRLTSGSIILVIVGVVLAIFNGSRLFILMEGCFSIIFHVRQRAVIKQNLMAIGMFFVFLVLIIIMAVAASLPSFITGLLSSLGIGKSPVTTVLYPIIGIVIAVFAAWVFFEAIYIIVPNQKISFSHSWIGSLVAAILLEIYMVLFPVYVAHFITGYAASISSVLILLIFFYYFGIILFLGAEVNAFFAEHITSTPTDLASLVHIATSHLPKDPQEKEDQAALSHKPEPLGDAASKAHVDTRMHPNNPDTQVSAIDASRDGKQQQ